MVTITSYILFTAKREMVQPPTGIFSGLAGTLESVGRREVLVGIGITASAALTTYASYKAYQGVRRTCESVRKWWRGPPQLLPAPCATSNAGAVGTFRSESARPGSEEVIMTAPKCQALVGFREDQKFFVLGNAVRIDQWLVVPDHVKAAAQQHQLELRLVGDNRTAGYELDSAVTDRFELVDTDLLAVALSEAEFSRIGLAKMTVTPSLDERNGAFVQIVGPYGKGTTGNLTHHAIFGKTAYNGSTFEGYSGAAYMAGRHIAGIHLHGGAFNGGYSASYVLAMLKWQNKIVDEDTSDWLTTYVKDKRNVVFDSSYLDDEDVRVRVSGRYHVVKKDSMARVWGKDWALDIDRVGRPRGGRYYEDQENAPPGNSQRRPSPGASGASKPSQPSVEELVAAQDWKGLMSFCGRALHQETQSVKH